jgi:GAF domain-containing protein
MNWFKTTHKWTLFGILFGCLFPLVGTLLEVRLLNLTFSWTNVLHAQRGQQILWIVDLAPLVLGIVFGFIGKNEQELEQTNKDLHKANQQLTELQAQLEQRVAERTADLEQANLNIQMRIEQFEAIAQVSRYISAINNLDSLLQKITSVISQQFGFYHAGIFLIDADKEYAVLKATNSDSGQKMLVRNHRLRVGSEGIVGFVTARGQARIALDVGADSVYFDNPDLPETCSEIALPLKVGDQIIGALDIQSTEQNAFNNEDVEVFTVLADQIAIAIQNTRSLEQAQSAAAEAEAIARQQVGEAWANIKRLTPVIGYRFDGAKPEPLTQSESGEQAESPKDSYSVPVHIRGEQIGRLRIKPRTEGYQWSEDEIAMIHATAERVALATENARLVLESQKRASKEQVIGEISSKIGASINLDNILQTTLREMGRILPGAEISIQVENE